MAKLRAAFVSFVGNEPTDIRLVRRATVRLRWALRTLRRARPRLSRSRLDGVQDWVESLYREARSMK